MHSFNILLLLPFLITGGFLIASVILLGVVPARMRKNTAICTVAVNARIVSYVKSNFSGTDVKYHTYMYAPVYEFTYNGEVHSVTPNLYSSRIPTVGEVRTLMIDPQNYDHFYDPVTRKRTKMVTTIVGVAMLLLGLIAAVINGLVILYASAV